ncbi:hypothetical protein HGRIS_005745 [Hohenbuehelia grisea]|uniref:Cytochrome c oxidase assembly protein COX20, mitochondrial n=1 Tax=Hohenbuehelia grisea TaxID=104357 RepID=A0ABR3JYT2_9AGAR
MSTSETNTAVPGANAQASSAIPPHPGYQKPTGNTVVDVWNSMKNITQIPCARNSLLSGIASGLGIGVIRGLSTGAPDTPYNHPLMPEAVYSGPLVAGNWAMATFTLISLGSWHICQRQLTRERETVQKIVDSLPQRSIKQADKGDVAAPS